MSVDIYVKKATLLYYINQSSPTVYSPGPPSPADQLVDAIKAAS